MNRNQQFVITLNRELGSGGRTVGRILAEKLGVPFYDKAVVKALQEKYKLTTEEIERLKGTKHSWWSDVERILKIDAGMNIDYYLPNDGKQPGLVTTGDMFKTESKILQELAAERSCVVAGRSGFHVFRNHPNHLSILIQASMKNRIDRVSSKQNMSLEEARKTIEQIDKMRETYVSKYAGTSRYDTRNYQLVISSDGKSEEEIADLILRYIG